MAFLHACPGAVSRRCCDWSVQHLVSVHDLLRQVQCHLQRLQRPQADPGQGHGHVRLQLDHGHWLVPSPLLRLGWILPGGHHDLLQLRLPDTGPQRTLTCLSGDIYVE